MIKVYSKATILIIFSFAVSTAAYNYYCRRKKEERQGIHEVLMFSSEMVQFKKSKLSKYNISQSMDRLLHYLSSPKHTLDICMYVFTNSDCAHVILKLHNKGVKVRLIVDADMAFTEGSCTRRLEKNGIPVRWTKSTNLMHHKFCLIDASCVGDRVIPLVMFGSLNWTRQGLFGNWEDVAITSQKELVQQYRSEFERLWVLFKPIVD